ncbi:unnamed protein product [Angiostrongylus costaricensis]|uniref:Astacin domain-containing protein n=1 Tax=Angiostrongylus costaricensis TaxID=334426 RepID=A0A0R3Q157_ANGCS|nr:unnamed protein product [Angiostrongylus costaricensis]
MRNHYSIRVHEEKLLLQFSSQKGQNVTTVEILDQIVRKVFKMGVKVLEDATCIGFFEDKNARDKVAVIKEDGCSSGNGRNGGDQLLSVGEGFETVRFI